jgi:hypothetical protein
MILLELRQREYPADQQPAMKIRSGLEQVRAVDVEAVDVNRHADPKLCDQVVHVVELHPDTSVGGRMGRHAP